jgi:predicted TPR repeat methyltransferase
MKYFENDQNINHVLECGCGDGRDGYVLSRKYRVHGVDNSGYIPKSEDSNLTFSCDNFVEMKKEGYDLLYSRFTFHSITNDQHSTFLKTVPIDTYLAIEARSVKGVDDHVHHGKDHYRNYIDETYIKKLLNENGFDIILFEEGRDMAVYKEENPICIRIICKK